MICLIYCSWSFNRTKFEIGLPLILHWFFKVQLIELLLPNVVFSVVILCLPDHPSGTCTINYRSTTKSQSATFSNQVLPRLILYEILCLTKAIGFSAYIFKEFVTSTDFWLLNIEVLPFNFLLKLLSQLLRCLALYDFLNNILSLFLSSIVSNLLLTL